MPALVFPRLVPHGKGAGPFSRREPKIKRAAASKPTSGRPADRECLPVSDNINRLAHDARNILSGFTLFCELLAAPGVLTKPHAHYAQDLESIAKSAAQILEKIVECAASAYSTSAPTPKALTVLAPTPVTDAAAELRHLQPLLAAIAGPAIRITVATLPCLGRTALAAEDLTRILVNLVRNAADALPAGGNIRITARYADGPSLDSGFPGSPRSLVLIVADDGPGIPEALHEQVFDPGFTTRSSPDQTTAWPALSHRGLGLSIVRSLVEAAGGAICALAGHPRGALFEISLPLYDAVTSGTYVTPPSTAFPADSHAKGCIECQ